MNKHIVSMMFYCWPTVTGQTSISGFSIERVGLRDVNDLVVQTKLCETSAY